jgi:hypothetical protein
MTPRQARRSNLAEAPRVDAVLAELRDALLTLDSGRIVLSWHWPKGEARYEITEFRHLPPVALTRKE